MFDPSGRLFVAYDSPVREDEVFEFEQTRAAALSGAITRNEMRASLGLDPVPWGDQPLVDKNMVAVGCGAEDPRDTNRNLIHRPAKKLSRSRIPETPTPDACVLFLYQSHEKQTPSEHRRRSSGSFHARADRPQDRIARARSSRAISSTAGSPARAMSSSFDPGERTDVSVITTDALDRDGEVVLPGGIDWSGYNRVVTFCHRYDQLPVGSNWWIRARGGVERAAHSSPRPITRKSPSTGATPPWLPSAVLHLMQQPVPTCTGKSIGFLPLHIREATAEERARRPELAGVPIIDRAAGIEYAVAPVPCNPEAQMQAVAKGRELGLIDDELEALLDAAASPAIAPQLKARLPLAMNEHGYAAARSLIVAGEVDQTTDWSFDAADEEAILGQASDWHRYSGCFLAIDPSTEPHARNITTIPSPNWPAES